MWIVAQTLKSKKMLEEKNQECVTQTTITNTNSHMCTATDIPTAYFPIMLSRLVCQTQEMVYSFFKKCLIFPIYQYTLEPEFSSHHAVFPKLNAGQILQECGYYVGTLSLKMRVLCGY